MRSQQMRHAIELGQELSRLFDIASFAPRAKQPKFSDRIL
jgi:hypothetical protein